MGAGNRYAVISLSLQCDNEKYNIFIYCRPINNIVRLLS